MRKKLTILGALTVAVVMGLFGLNNTSTTTEGALQSFSISGVTEVDWHGCYDTVPANTPVLSGGRVVCNASNPTTLPSATTVTHWSLINLPRGNRLTLPITFTPMDTGEFASPSIACFTGGPTGNNECDAGTITGTVTARPDVACNDVADVLAQSTSPGPGGAWPDESNWTPFDFTRIGASVANGGNGEITSGDNAYIHQIVPFPTTGPAAWNFSTADLSQLDTIWLGGTIPIPITPVTRLQLVSYQSTFAGQTGLSASVALLGGSPDGVPTDNTQLCLDSPQDSSGKTVGLITPTGNRVIPRWTIFTSDLDDGDASVDTILDWECYTVGTGEPDADQDCDPDATDTNDAVDDIDGDGLPDGIERQLASDPTDTDSDNDGFVDNAGVSGGGCSTTGAGTGGFGNRLFVYRRVVDGTEPASYTWTFGGAIVHAGAAGGIIRFSGVDTASPIVAEGGQTTASATSHTAPSINTGAVTNTMLVSSHSANSSTLWDPPGGMTERVDAASLAVPDALGLAIEVNHETFAGSGATGTRTASFTAPAPAADTGLTHMLALRPAVAFSHYAITGPSGTTFATCEPAVVRITAHNAAHVAVNPPAGTTLALRTSTNSGVWLAFSAGAGDLGTAANFVTLGLNDGQASYTWSGSESVLQVRLRHNTATALSVNLNPAGSPQEDAGEDPTFTFADSVMRVTADGSTSATVGTQIAGKPSDTGAGAQTLYVQAVATAPATGACTTLFRNQTVNVEFAAVCENPTACSAVAETDMWVQNNASAYVSVAKNNGPGTPASYTAVPLAFSNDANAMAPLVLRYGDAGQVRLYLRSALPSPPAGTYVSGSSNSFVVRPFGFAFPAVQHGVDQTSAVLAAAGDNFAMNVAAYKWSAADDDGTGNPRTDITINLTDNGIVIPANSVTPSFAALTTVAVLAGSNTPGVADGTITRQSTGLGDIAAGEFSGGSSAVADWRYSEVGNVTFRATSSNYLGSGASITGRSTMDGTGNRVGRFKPKHFALLGAPAPTLTNRAAIGACAASTFTYMNEGLSLAFSLEAQNAQNAKTSNYTGAYAKLSTASLAPFNLGARSGGTDLTSRIDTGVAPSGSWSNGTLALTATTGIKRNNAGPNPQDNPDGPFTGILWGIAPNDNDPDPGSGVQMNTLDLDVDGVGGNDHKNLGVSTEVRFGRLRCQNALGSDKTALPMPMTAEYWNGTAFTTNLLDSCTPIAPADIGKGNFRGNLTAPELGAPTVTAISSGAGRITLPKPSGGDGNYVGALDVTFNVSGAGLPFLLGNWSAADPDSSAATAYDDNPVCGASFGLYGSQPKQFIFFRENY